MKFIVENEIDLTSPSSAAIIFQKRKDECREFAVKIFPQLRALIGLPKGMVLDIRPDFPLDTKWPTLDQWTAFTTSERFVFVSKIRLVTKPLIAALDDQLRGSNNGRYAIAWRYVGNGRIALFWRGRKLKAKKSNASTSGS